MHDANHALESVAGIGLPVLEHRYSSTSDDEGVLESQRLRVFLEDLDTLLVLFADHKKFYVLKRSVTRKGKQADYTTPIYAVITTNLLAWLVPKLMESLGVGIVQYEHHLAHIASLIMH